MQNMGVKRPLEEKDFPELSFKQPKQIDNDFKLTFMTDGFSSHRTSQTVDSPGETKNNCCEFNIDGMLENGDLHDSSLAPKESEASVDFHLVTSTEFDASTPLPLVTSSSSSEEDAENEDTSFTYNFPGYVDLSIPWRPPELYHDAYTLLLNSSPRKEVPIGPDYQTEVPLWDPSSSRKDLVNGDWEQKMLGTCVIPFPALYGESTIVGVEVGRGRTDCDCLDVGSMRCVQQHIREAREKLHETIGEEAFTKSGFYDMGEEVATKWRTEDEHLFHEVVFSNPVSLGGDFWKHLSNAFPNRSKSELVSYYFNVFMLRRRAVQNRSYVLQIDSDDDEDHSVVAHGDKSPVDENESDDENEHQNIHGEEFYVCGQDDDDSAFGSFGDQALDVGWVDVYHPEPEPKHKPKPEPGNLPSEGNVDENEESEK